VICHLRDASCVALHPPLREGHVSRQGRAKQVVPSLKQAQLEIGGLVYRTKALKAQHSMVGPRYMAQTSQLGSWAKIAGHVIGP